MNTQSSVENTYGGDATITKLVVAMRYMAAFNLALSNTGFTRWYIDGFAGTGEVNIKRDRFAGKTVKGSARIALDLPEPGFHKFRFIDQRQSHVDELEALISNHTSSSAHAYYGDANRLIPTFCANLMESSARAFVFIDPFATEVAWTTVEALARSKAADVLLMFPAGAVRQMLPREGMPPESWEPKLDKLFGGRYWAGAYRETTVPGFWEQVRRLHTDEGFEDIVGCYRDRLVSAFTDKGVVPLQFPLLRKKHRPGTQLFELMFASANPSGQELATKIAREIMEKAQRDGEGLLHAAESLVLGVWGPGDCTSGHSWGAVQNGTLLIALAWFGLAPAGALELLSLLCFYTSGGDVPGSFGLFPLISVVFAAHDSTDEGGDHSEDQAPAQTSPEAHLSFLACR